MLLVLPVIIKVYLWLYELQPLQRAGGNVLLPQPENIIEFFIFIVKTLAIKTGRFLKGTVQEK